MQLAGVARRDGGGASTRNQDYRHDDDRLRRNYLSPHSTPRKVTPVAAARAQFGQSRLRLIHPLDVPARQYAAGQDHSWPHASRRVSAVVGSIAALSLQHSERASLMADRWLERRSSRIAFRRQRHRLDDDRRERDLESRREPQGDRTDAGQCDRRGRIQACKKESRLHEAFVTLALIIVSAIRQKNVRQKNKRRQFSVSHFYVW